MVRRHNPYHLSPSTFPRQKEELMIKIAVVALVQTFIGICAAGPLGMEMGTPLTEIQSKVKLKTESPYQFSTPSLPDSHPDFNDYRMVVTPQHGLCKLTAWASAIRTSVYGSELLSSFDRYFNVMTTKYGTGKRFDYLNSGSIWNDGKDWMMALRKKERTLAVIWTAKELALPDNLAAIKIEAYVGGAETGLISISYEFKNASDCIDWIQSRKDSKL